MSGRRLLVVLPTWLGDSVMATPALRLLRQTLGNSVIIGACRPGVDDVLAGLDSLDDLVVADSRSVLGPAKAAARLKPLRCDAALLLPNSFSAAVTARLAGIPLRIGYDRDGRGALLTHRLSAPMRTAPGREKQYAPISAVAYYLEAARGALAALGTEPAAPFVPRLELALTPVQERQTSDLLVRANLTSVVTPADRSPHAAGGLALLNPGGNNPAKRWPVERFAAIAHHLISRHGLTVAINGSPGEASLASLIRDALILHNPEDATRLRCLPELGGTIGTLKGLVRASRIMVTNDTGPRHIAAAFDVPCVTLFGPTDPRWTTLPESTPPRELVLVADPTLPDAEVADDHPERCRIERISIESVQAALDELLSRRPAPGEPRPASG